MPTVWLLNLDDEREAASSCLSPHEEEQAHQYARPIDAQRYRAAHGALRSVLSGLTGKAPEVLCWAHLPQGKPVLLGADVPSFNLSHSRAWGAIACCSAPHAPDVGVDIECATQAIGLERAIDQFMSPQELHQWQQLPNDDRPLAALCCWTRKEAVLKALGCGLQGDLTSFTVGLEPKHATTDAGHPTSPTVSVWSWWQPMGLPVMLSVALVADGHTWPGPVEWELRRFRATSRSDGPA